MLGLRNLSSLVLLLSAERSAAFVTRPVRASPLVAVHGVPFFADAGDDAAPAAPPAAAVAPAAATPPADVVLSTSAGDDAAIRAAAIFMVDSFWLRSPQDLIFGGGDPASISAGARSSLITEQEEDLTGKYGEIMGARRLKSGLFTASDGEGLLGLVGAESRLLDLGSMGILAAESSEAMLKNAVASLGPKQRREYKDSTPAELVKQLLPSKFRLVVVVSNLAVAPRARRRGVAASLCREAERMTKDEWGFPEVCLQVEGENAAARGLYEGKLGYTKVASSAATGLRVDVENGTFEEVPVETLLLTKTL